MGGVDQDPLRGVTGMRGDDLVIGQHLDTASGTPHLDAPPNPSEWGGIATLFEADGGVLGYGAHDGDIERLRKDRQRGEMDLLQRQALGDTGAGRRTQPALGETGDMLIGGLLKLIEAVPVSSIEREAAAQVADEPLDLALGLRMMWQTGIDVEADRARISSVVSVDGAPGGRQRRTRRS